MGTSIIDNDGEDVSSRGRILLLELKRSSSLESDSFDVELNFVYDKEISIGPVTAISHLASENKSRLVVGAGAEITIEQWGNGKLLQVGFFHANMVRHFFVYRGILRYIHGTHIDLSFDKAFARNTLVQKFPPSQ